MRLAPADPLSRRLKGQPGKVGNATLNARLMADINIVSLSGVLTSPVETARAKDVPVARFYIDVEGAGDQRPTWALLASLSAATKAWLQATSGG